MTQMLRATETTLGLAYDNAKIEFMAPWFCFLMLALMQSYEIKSPPWPILWFRILGIFSVENIKRLCVFMFQTWDNNQLLRRVLWIFSIWSHLPKNMRNPYPSTFLISLKGWWIVILSNFSNMGPNCKYFLRFSYLYLWSESIPSHHFLIKNISYKKRMRVNSSYDKFLRISSYIIFNLNSIRKP